MSNRNGQLSVKGAKFNTKNQETEKQVDKILTVSKAGNNNAHNDSFLLLQTNNSSQPQLYFSDLNTSTSSKLLGVSTKEEVRNVNYWKTTDKNNDSQSLKVKDIVIIHVCDENQHITKDFCCKRDILINHMKYFEKFLADNDNGYEDIDISVHCDVEIFEWLMDYIHEPMKTPKFDKATIISILISSEFLQMESLVELCVQHVANNLNDIIKLPIDLSCISEKLINRIALITQPRVLSETKDKKDKILNKLYKRRVELDFSRKGSAPKIGSGTNVSISPTTTASSSTITVPLRTIAASLTCCYHCGMVYLENYMTLLHCKNSPPTIDFRGRLTSRHASISGWSLTSYLKTLHTGGMAWDAIYWHVWAACIVFRVENVMISAVEVDRYTVEPDGLCIKASFTKDESISNESDIDDKAANFININSNNTYKDSYCHSEFSLSSEDNIKSNLKDIKILKLPINKKVILTVAPGITSTLNPLRSPDILTTEIFDLICTQMKYIVGISHKILIQNIMQSAVDLSKLNTSNRFVDFGNVLWGNPIYPKITSENKIEIRRGRSAIRSISNSNESRKVSQSVPKNQNNTKNRNINNNSTTTTITTNESIGSNIVNDIESNENNTSSERRSRSSSLTGKLSNNLQNNNTSMITNNDTSNININFNELIYYNNNLNDDLLDPLELKQISIFKSITPELYNAVNQMKGPIYGIWMHPHPLQLRSLANLEMLQLIDDSNLPALKKLEWELDILREFDEKRMEQFEKFLISRRQKNNEKNNKIITRYKQIFNNKSGNNLEYYKDKGRQPNR